MRQLRDALSLTHYRVDHETYIDVDLWETNLVELGWQAVYAWFRLLSGPEYVREGFPSVHTEEALDPREINGPAAIESLTRAGFIVERDGYLTFPNVIWGMPPEEDCK